VCRYRILTPETALKAEEDGGTTFARYECKVTVHREGVEGEMPASCEWRERAQIKLVEIHNGAQAMVMEGMKMDENQAWFVN
jgi:hypothetical protein